MRFPCSTCSIAGVGNRLISGRRATTAPAVVTDASAVAAFR
jgi:hypothetical protein